MRSSTLFFLACLLLVVGGGSQVYAASSVAVPGTMHGFDDIFFANVTFPVWGGEDGVKIKLTETSGRCELDLCLQYLIQPLKTKQSIFDDVWQKSCLSPNQYVGEFLRNVTNNYEHETLRVLPGSMVLGLRQLASSSCSFVVDFIGDECPEGTNGNDCETVTEELPVNQPITDKASFVFFPTHRNYTNGFTVKVTTGGTSANFGIYLRNGDLPRWHDVNDVKCDHQAYNESGNYLTRTINIELPRIQHHHNKSRLQGYFVTIWNKDNVSTPFTAEIIPYGEQCEYWVSRGPDCQYVAMIYPQIDYTIPGMEAYKFYYVEPRFTHDQVNFSFAVSVLDGQVSEPHFYIRQGNIPTTEIYDMEVHTAYTQPIGSSGFTRWYRSISIDHTAFHNGPWFIGVYENKEDRTGSFGFWMDSDCPNDCSNHGKCDTHTHECECDEDWDQNLWDCSIPNPGVYVTPPDNPNQGWSATEITLFSINSVFSVLLIVLIVAGAGLYYYVQQNRNYQSL